MTAIAVDDATVRKTVELATATDTAVPIEMATETVSELLSGKGLSGTKITLITLNLACHFALMFQGGQLVRKWQGETREEYAGKFGEGLNATIYGQTAQIMDTSGTLANLSSPRPKAQFRTIGTAQSYAQRRRPSTGDTNDVES